jgi:hypothetical protein
MDWGPHSGYPGDGSSGNAGPALTTIVGTESNPKALIPIAAFDKDTDEHLWFQFQMPAYYASAPVVKLQWMANSKEAQKVAWGVRLAAVTPGDADTPVEHAEAEAVVVSAEVNTTEARRLIETSIEPKTDSVAAGDYCKLVVYRDADASGGQTDSLTVDAELVRVVLSFTTT